MDNYKSLGGAHKSSLGTYELEGLGYHVFMYKHVGFASRIHNQDPMTIGAEKELSDGGSPRVIVYEYDGLPMLPVAPPSPDYIPGLEEPHTSPAPQDEDEHDLMFIQPHDPDFVPEPIYHEYILLEDEHILPAEEQPLPPVVSPTAESPGYVAESDPEEDLKEYEEDEIEDRLVDYPMDRGDDGDDEGDSSRYDANDEDEGDEDEEEEEEEEEHLTLADSAIIIHIDELVSSPEGTEPIIPPPSTDTTTTRARITIRPQTSISLPPEAEVERLLAMPTPSPSPLTSLSPPSIGEYLARCTAPDALPSPLLPPSLYLPPPVDRRDGIPESEQPPYKRLCLSTLGSRYEVGESSTRGREVDYGFADTVEAEMRHRGIREVGYGIGDTWIDPIEAVLEMEPTTLEKVNTIVIELAELLEHDTHDVYALLEDAQDGRARISQRVAMDSQQIMAPVTRQGHNPPPSNTNTPPQQMTLELVQAMIDQAFLRNSTNEDGSQSSHEDNPRHVQTTRPCFYADFIKCHPLNFKGNECIVRLTRWIKKMESIRTLGPKAYAMTWEVLKKKMIDKSCLQKELKKLKIELWNLKVKGNDVPTYTNRFQELTLICTKFVANENKKIDKYISELPDNIYRNLKSSKPRTLDETIELTNDLMDHKLHTYAEKADNKRKTDDTSRNNHGHQQQPFKRCHAVIVCDEKLVQIRFGSETLTFRGNESNNGRESRLTVISCSKAQEYMAKGCQIFMAQISAKKEEDKSEGKQIKDVPIIRDFPKVFPEDLPGLPPARPVEFQIDLIPGAAPVA
nr:reverse transcriptase domain-containing protein [Tanacetum cinerariifolium]